MRKTRSEQQERPAEKLIPRYQKARLLAHRATIRSLVRQLSDTGPTVDEATSRDEFGMQDNVVMSETRYSAIQNRIDHLETQIETMREENNRLNQQLEDRPTANKQAQKLLKKKERTIAKLRTRLEEASTPGGEVEAETPKPIASTDTGELERQLRRAGSAIAVDHTPLGLRVRIAQRVLFAPGEVSLKPEARRSLSTLAEHLKRFPDREIRVQGHTDDVPINTPRYPSNWELSSHRSVNVVKHLVEEEGLKAERIGAVAFGPHRPLVPNTSSENRAKNRRVEILLLSPSLSEVSE